MVDSLYFSQQQDLPDKLVEKSLDLCASKTTGRVLRNSRNSLNKREVWWLLHKAFLTVVAKRSSGYGSFCCGELRKRTNLAGFEPRSVIKELVHASNAIVRRGTVGIRSHGYQKVN